MKVFVNPGHDPNVDSGAVNIVIMMYVRLMLPNRPELCWNAV